MIDLTINEKSGIALLHHINLYMLSYKPYKNHSIGETFLSQQMCDFGEATLTCLIGRPA